MKKESELADFQNMYENEVSKLNQDESRKMQAKQKVIQNGLLNGAHLNESYLSKQENIKNAKIEEDRLRR